MKNLIILILVLISISVKAQEKQLTDEEKIYGLSLIWQEVNYNFAYMQDYNLDWDSLYIANIPKVVAARNLTEYYSILSSIMNSFHEGHTTISLPPEVKQMYGYVAMSMAYIDGNYYVTGFTSEYKDKISIGSILISVNDIDIDQYFDRFVFPNHNVAEHRAKRYLSRGRFFKGLLSEKLTATFLNANGKTVSLKLNRTPYISTDVELIKIPEKYEHKDFLYKKYDDISYIRIGSFLNNTASTSFSKIVDSLKNSKAIIFDIRGNTGGNSQYATDIITYFSDKNPVPIYWGQNKVNKSFSRAVGTYTYLHGDSLAKANNYYADYVTRSHYEGGQYNYPNQTKGDLKGVPVVVLCNSFTISAAESFIIQLKHVVTVTVIGEPSAGSSTMALIIPLPGGGTANIASVKALDENGKPYKYTQPDITHIPSFEDEKTGTDSVLKIAIDFINNRD